jgi:hypothetical protein
MLQWMGSVSAVAETAAVAEAEEAAAVADAFVE